MRSLRLRLLQNESGQLAIVLPLSLAVTMAGSMLWAYMGLMSRSALAEKAITDVDRVANSISSRLEKLLYGKGASACKPSPPGGGFGGAYLMDDIALFRNLGAGVSANQPAPPANRPPGPPDPLTVVKYICTLAGVGVLPAPTFPALDIAYTNAPNANPPGGGYPGVAAPSAADLCSRITNCLAMDGTAGGQENELPNTNNDIFSVEVDIQPIGAPDLLMLSTNIATTIIVTNQNATNMPPANGVTSPRKVARVYSVHNLRVGTLGGYGIVFTDPAKSSKASVNTTPQLQITGGAQVEVFGSIYSGADNGSAQFDNTPGGKGIITINPATANLLIHKALDLRADKVLLSAPGTVFNAGTMQQFVPEGVNLGVFNSSQSQTLPISDLGPFGHAWEEQFWYPNGDLSFPMPNLLNHVAGADPTAVCGPVAVGAASTAPCMVVTPPGYPGNVVATLANAPALPFNSDGSFLPGGVPYSKFPIANLKPSLPIAQNTWPTDETCGTGPWTLSGGVTTAGPGPQIFVYQQKDQDFTINMSSGGSAPVGKPYFCGVMRARVLTINLAAGAVNLFFGNIIADQIVVNGPGTIYFINPADNLPVPSGIGQNAQGFWQTTSSGSSGPTLFNQATVYSQIRQVAASIAHNFFVPVLQTTPQNNQIGYYPFRPAEPVIITGGQNNVDCGGLPWIGPPPVIWAVPNGYLDWNPLPSPGAFTGEVQPGGYVCRCDPINNYYCMVNQAIPPSSALINKILYGM